VRPPPRPSSAANSSYCSPCILLILKHAPGCTLTSSTHSHAHCFLPLPLLDYSTGPPSPDRAATSPSLWPALQQPINAPALPELTVVLLYHFISAEQGRKPRIRHCRPSFVPGELCSPWAAVVSLPLLKLTPEQASSSPAGAPRTYPDANSPLDCSTDACRLGSSPLPFGSPSTRRSRRSLPSTSVPPEPHHPGVAPRPHPHPSPSSSTSEHHRRDQAPLLLLRVAAVPPPPVNSDLHITPSKVRLSPLNLPGQFPLAAGDRRRRSLADASRLLFPDKPRTQLL
jgi:hypothetical protein